MNTKRMTSILPVLSLFLLIDLATNAQAVTYSFKILDAPEATSTHAASINDSGQVAGYYVDASGAEHGFVYGGGQFMSLDPPGATSISVTSINDSGQVTGSYSAGCPQWCTQAGFVYSRGQFTLFAGPADIDLDGIPLGTISPTSINASGQVTGNYYDASYTPHGFLYSGGQYTSLDPPGAIQTSTPSINDSGQVAGYYVDASGAEHGFVYSRGQFMSLDFPAAITNCFSVDSINASGQVVGSYLDASYTPHGFVYSGSQFTSLDVPGAKDTRPNSINDSGQVTGNYYDASYTPHGFLYSGGQYTSLDPPGARSTSAISINNSGQVTGSYVDTSGAEHGFIATPMTPFSTFNVTPLIIDQNRGALFLWSHFALGGDSNGIDPVKEKVTLKIANATLTISAGSFHKNSHPSFFAFAGQVDNVWIEAFIRPSGRNHFRFQALAYGAPLGDLKNPIPVELTIGDDKGTTTANASLH